MRWINATIGRGAALSMLLLVCVAIVGGVVYLWTMGPGAGDP